MRFDHCFNYSKGMLILDLDAIDARNAVLGDIIKAKHSLKYRPRFHEFSDIPNRTEIDVIVAYDIDSVGDETYATVYKTAFDYDGNEIELTNAEAEAFENTIMDY